MSSTRDLGALDGRLIGSPPTSWQYIDNIMKERGTSLKEAEQNGSTPVGPYRIGLLTYIVLTGVW